MTDMITLPGVQPDMIANNLDSFEPTHPGTLIKDELAARGLTQAKLAEQLGIHSSQLNEIIRCKRAVNTEMAMMLEAALQIPAHVWLGLQNDYNMQMAKNNKKFMMRLADIRRVAAML